MPKIYLYGASNTDGFDPRGMLKGRYGPEYRFPDVLRRILGPAWQVVEDGLNGRKIPQDSFLLEYFLQKLEKALPLDYVAIMLGTNDLISQREPDTAVIMERMKHLCSRSQSFLKVHHSHAKLLLVTPPPLHIYGDDGEDYGEAMARLQAAYEVLAREHHWLFVDTRFWNLALAYDGIHLSEQGSRAMGVKLAAWLKMIEGRC